MKKIYLIISIFFLFQNFGIADFNKHEIKEGNPDAKIKIYVYYKVFFNKYQ